MSSDENFVKFVVDQIENAGAINYKKCLASMQFIAMAK
jgi:hypothetical protein